VVHWGIDADALGSRRIVRVAGGVTTASPIGSAPRRLWDDGTTVYWTTVYSSCVFAWPGEGEPVMLGPCHPTSDDVSPGLAGDAENVYWAVSRLDGAFCGAYDGQCCGPGGNSCILGAPKGGSVPEVLVGGRGVIQSLVRSGSDLFFTSWVTDDGAGTGLIERCPAAAGPCTPQPVLSADGLYKPRELAVAGGYLYWSTAAGKILRKPLAELQAAPEELAKDTYVNYMAGDDTHLYFTLITGVMSGQVARIAHSTPKVAVAIGGTNAGHLAVDCTGAYWADGQSVMFRPR
jgi:hypothetical protein